MRTRRHEATAAKILFLDIGNDGTLADIERQCGVPLKPSTMPMWGSCSGVTKGGKTLMIESLLNSVAIQYGVPVDRLLGRGPTNPTAEKEMGEYFDRLKLDIVAKAEARKNENVQKYVAQAAFKLGRQSSKMLTSQQRNQEKREIKSMLANQLRACGLGWAELKSAMSDFVEAIRNV